MTPDALEKIVERASEVFGASWGRDGPHDTGASIGWARHCRHRVEAGAAQVEMLPRSAHHEPTTCGGWPLRQASWVCLRDRKARQA